MSIILMTIKSRIAVVTTWFRPSKKLRNSILALSIFTSSAIAKEYGLLNPTPKSELRPLTTERSSKSDYVTTVDPGHAQLETSFFSVVKNKKTTIGDAANIRFGLTENSDLQFITNLYTNNVKENKQGFGNTTIRYKYSFGGNGNEKFGIAAIPFISLPTSQDKLEANYTQGGLGIPFAYAVDNFLTIGGMSQINFLKNKTGYANAIYLCGNFSEKFYAFAELYTYKTSAINASWQNTADFGLHYYVTRYFKVDVGANIGITKAADNLNYYSGFAYKF